MLTFTGYNGIESSMASPKLQILFKKEIEEFDMIGKCPSCGKNVTRLNGNGVDASFGIGTTPLKALTYNCPFCYAVLGCQIDPIAVRTEIVSQTVDELLKRLKR